jgi:predicted transport protein
MLSQGGIMEHVKLETVSIKYHPELNEAWVQQIIADDPSILGLGDVLLRDRERRQPRAGRLDLLLQDPDTNKRYEVEVQLGPTYESHIIRTIEYWDLERKRYPQYDHCAVLVAEDITSRFLNIVSIFNGMVPLVAIQMRAVKVGDGIGLTFTKVIDELALGMIDEDEEVHEVADRNYWLKRGSKKTVDLADKILKIISSFDPTLEFKYNKFYIGLAKSGIPNNFVACKPKKQWINLEIRLPEDSKLTNDLEESGLDAEYLAKWGKYRLRLREGDIEANIDLLKDLFQKAYEHSQA